MERRKQGWRWLCIYSGLFALFFVACHGVIYLTGGTPIWRVDGLMQHYPFMIYVGQWVREAVQSLFSGARVATFDFSLALGEDVFAAVNYYGMGDPLLLISALFSGESTEACYVLLTVLRSYLAGLTCIALARYKRFEWKQAVCAGVIYAFSISMFAWASIRHAMFGNPYVHFPLMILGMEMVFDRKKGWALSLGVGLTALCGFYFLYISSLLMLMYALVRQFTRGEEKPWRTLMPTALRALGWYALGIGLSAAVFLPALVGFFNCAREPGSLSGVRWAYSLGDYLRYPQKMVSGWDGSNVPCVPAIVWLGVALMLVRRRREDRGWIAVLAAGFVLTLIPAVGSLLNGFAYEASRWTYSLMLLLALIGGRMTPELFHLEKREKKWMIGLTALYLAYIAALVALGISGVGGRMRVAMAGGVLGGSAVFVLLVNAPKVRARLPKAALGAGLMVVLLLNTSLGHVMHWREKQNLMAEPGESYASIVDSPVAALEPGDGVSRVDSSTQYVDVALNSGALYGVPTTLVYNSMINRSGVQFFKDMGCAGYIQKNCYAGMDARAAMEALWSVDRYVCADDENVRVPYGFVKSEVSDGMAVYKNQYALPVGYVYTQWISEEEYAQISPLERQWALLQCAVLERAPEGVTEGEALQSIEEIAVEHIEYEDVELEDGMLVAGENACIRLTFSAPADCELYAAMHNFYYIDGVEDLQTRAYFETEDASFFVMLMPGTSPLFVDYAKESALQVNLGYSEKERKTVEIRFSKSGRYHWNGVSLYAQPMAEFGGLVEGLQGLEEVVVSNNEISGEISLDQPGIMAFSIPWSPGWSVWVDGERREVLQHANSMLAVALDAGAHEVRLEYHSPGLRLGIGISLLSAIALAALAMGRRRRMTPKGVKA